MPVQWEEKPLVPWEIFEKEASKYEPPPTTRHGQRVAQAEYALLEWLLADFPTSLVVLEIGCGTGHFTAWLFQRGLRVIGLDRAPAMLVEMHRRFPEIPAIRGDAHCLPFREEEVDLAVFITTLEFLEKPTVALTEAVRVARQGLLVVALNRWSLGGISRRWGLQARRSLLRQARDYSIVSLRKKMRKAAGKRLQKLYWTSTLFPNGLWKVQTSIPVGEVIGIAVVLAEP
jgi:ubiquinone/menaquinone biosynthesis C-methylase UbiE